MSVNAATYRIRRAAVAPLELVLVHVLVLGIVFGLVLVVVLEARRNRPFAVREYEIR